MNRLLPGLLMAGLARAAFAADAPAYAPAPAWVLPAAPATAGKTSADQPVRILLQDSQVHFSGDGDETFTETITRAQTPQGLALMGSLSRTWDPQTDVLTINRLRILRGGQVIDVLAQGKTFTILRREQNLEQSTLDGRLTATLQLEDLRVGDVIDFASTIRHHDPSFAARSEQVFAEPSSIVVDRLRFRALWPKAMPTRWRESEGLAAPQLRDMGADRELTIDMTDAKAPKPPRSAPPRYSELGQIQLSAYRAWPEVSATLSPLFVSASSLGPDSPLRAEAARIRAQSPDPATQAALALTLVEDKVRYVFLGADLGGYKPAAVDLTWSRRFGDCKGKTVLLVALLRELGLDATPVLVSTNHGDGLDARLPSLGLFNHAIVRLRLGGRTYWLDGTRTGDRRLADLPPPSYRWALPLTPAGADLEPIVQAPLDRPNMALSLTLDASQGLTAPAPAHGEVTLRGDAAIGVGQMIRIATAEDLDKSGRQFWSSQFKWITIKTVSTTFDAVRGEARFTMDGVAQLDWREDDSGANRRFPLNLARLGSSLDIKREADTRQDAPYQVAFPSFTQASETLILPDHARGYSLEGRDIDRTLGAIHYRRATRLEDGRAVSVATEVSLAPEFPATEALTVANGLASLAEETVWVRAPVSYGLTSQEKQGLSALDPTTTEGFFNRADEMLRKMETDKAIADFDEVIRREPGMAPAHLGRGLAWMRKGRLDQALTDFDQALKLQPDLLGALYARAEARYLDHRWDEALTDVGEAIRLAPNEAAPYEARGSLLLRMGRANDALADYQASLRINPEDATAMTGRARAYAALGRQDLARADLGQIGQSADVLNWRCFARAVAGVTLDEAIGECDAALRLAPTASHILDSRGFVWFRKGEWARAVADFDAALRLDPKLAESLYVRGLARKRLGQAEAGETDIRAALALDAQIARTYADYGVKE